MVERSRRQRDMYENTIARIILTTAVFAALAVLAAGPANALVMDVEGGGGSGATAGSGGSDGTGGRYADRNGDA